MNQSSKLFELIHSLSMSEKRHFKLSYQNNNKNTIYIKLFDAILAQDSFDDYAIKEKFKKETFVKQFNVTKLYLYDLISKSLVNYHQKNNIEIYVKSIIQEALVLIDRTLYQQAVIQILRAKKVAHEYELYLDEYNCLSLLKRLFTTRISLDKWKYDLQRLNKEEQEVSENLSQINHLNDVQAKLADFLRDIPFVSTKEQREIIMDIIKPIYSLEAENIPSFSSKIIYYNIMVNYYHFMNDLSKTKQFTLLRYKCLKQGKFKIIEAERKEIGYLSNHIQSCLDNRSFDEAAIYIKELKSILTRDKKLLYSPSYIKRFTVAYNIIINYYIETGTFTEGLSFVKPIVSEFETIHIRSTDDKVHFVAILLSTTLLYMGANKLDEALSFNNKILNQNIKSSNVHYGLAQLLSLIIHYDLGNYRFVEQMIPTTQKALRRNRLYSISEKTLLSGLNKLSKTALDSTKHKKALLVLQRSLNKIERNPNKQNLLLYYDIDAWLKSKIKNKTVAEIIKARIS